MNATRTIPDHGPKWAPIVNQLNKMTPSERLERHQAILAAKRKKRRREAIASDPTDEELLKLAGIAKDYLTSDDAVS